ncbi:uncharacterized protein CPUR_01087 [Claviceps purpurea 20.1]|uniref:HAT C-terminal dimerisation domain-containing protein n=1 Tax=Claviceps purpurea (strain 20.1) TaxID=1111077 RepID=M1W637_CLAP2|nr:uncharacterized protein CPUR_01087 [Claviceps purpurea 20.1]
MATAQQLRDVLLAYTIQTNSDLGCFTDPNMKALLPTLAPATLRNIGDRTAMKAHLNETFPAKKALVKLQMQKTLTKIHLSYDLSTSPDDNAILAVSAHFLDDNGIPQQRLIALRQQYGTSGNDIAKALREVITEWDLESHIGCVMSDGASNKDSSAEVLFQSLNPEYEKQDAIERYLYCYRHAFSLIGRVALYGEDFEAFERASQRLNCEGLSDDLLSLWRRRGPIGKLHNLVMWVRSSPQRKQLFNSTVPEAQDSGLDILLASVSTLEQQLVLNDSTRWRSTFLMIRRALAQRDHIKVFIAKNASEVEATLQVPKEDRLDDQDWLVLDELHPVLTPLYELASSAPASVPSAYGNHALWETLTCIEYIHKGLRPWIKLFGHGTIHPCLPASQPHPRQAIRDRQAAAQCADRYSRLEASSQAHLRVSIMNGWSKLNEYFESLEKSPLYAAAVILHPGLGTKCLPGFWAQTDTAVNDLHRYRHNWYQNGATGPKLRAGSQSVPFSAELEQYIRPGEWQSEGGFDNPIQWWMRNRGKFPTVSKLALDILAIPANTVDCARALEASKLTMASQCEEMAPDTLEKVECLRNWLYRSAVVMGGLN